MAIIRAFRALLPEPSRAAAVASVPYDVVDTAEAKVLAEGHPLSFLRISKAELELPTDLDPYSEVVYRRAASNFARLRDMAYRRDETPSAYVYRLRAGNHQQTGVAGCYSIDEYEHDIIRKHERTRRDKEDDRTRHMLALGAQTGPVLLTYRASSEIDAVVSRVTAAEPMFGFEAADGVRHTLWRAGIAESAAIVAGFAPVPVLYIADGHHRAASAARARAELRQRGAPLGDDAGYDTMLGVAFPHDEMQILAYNRVVKDLGARTHDEFLRAVEASFTVEPGPATPRHHGEIAMYLQGNWRTLRLRVPPDPADRVGSLDVSVLQDRLLAPVLGIADVRTDKRIDFIGGGRGTAELEHLVDDGAAAVAFSMAPVTVEDLMSVSDAGSIMPPKSTWFEPKLRDGLLIHMI